MKKVFRMEDHDKPRCTHQLEGQFLEDRKVLRSWNRLTKSISASAEEGAAVQYYKLGHAAVPRRRADHPRCFTGGRCCWTVERPWVRLSMMPDAQTAADEAVPSNTSFMVAVHAAAIVDRATPTLRLTKRSTKAFLLVRETRICKPLARLIRSGMQGRIGPAGAQIASAFLESHRSVGLPARRCTGSSRAS